MSPGIVSDLAIAASGSRALLGSAGGKHSRGRQINEQHHEHEGMIATSKHRPHMIKSFVFLCLFVANTFFQ